MASDEQTAAGEVGSPCHSGVANVGVPGSTPHEGMGRGGPCILPLSPVNVPRVGSEIQP